jgi:hypothetical protein
LYVINPSSKAPVKKWLRALEQKLGVRPPQKGQVIFLQVHRELFRIWSASEVAELLAASALISAKV